MERWIIFIMLPVLMLAGCVTSGNSVDEKNSQDIVDKTVSALSRAVTFTLDTSLINAYNYNSNNFTNVNTYGWIGTKSIDMARKQMFIDMTIYANEYYSLEHFTHRSIEIYLYDGWQFERISPQNSSEAGPWTKQRPESGTWDNEILVPFIIDLMKTIGQSSISGSDTISGVGYYILTISADAQSSVDFLRAQSQPIGSQIGVMNGGAITVVRPDALMQSTVRLWIDKSSSLPSKIEVDMQFRGETGEGPGGSLSTPMGISVDSIFHEELRFSRYNQPISIVLPLEATGAQKK